MATEREIANYPSHQGQDSNKCPNTPKQYSKADKTKTIKTTITVNKGIPKTTTKTRKTTTRKDRIGETPDQEETHGIYANYAEKVTTQQ